MYNAMMASLVDYRRRWLAEWLASWEPNVYGGASNMAYGRCGHFARLSHRACHQEVCCLLR